MSTYLELVNRLASESGVSGAASSVSTVIGQTGMALRFVNWVRDAHTELQNRHNGSWKWLRSTWTMPTVIGTDTYSYGDALDANITPNATITRFKNWITHDSEGACNIKRYLTSGGVSGESWMSFVPWDYFRGIYKIGTQNNGQIIHVTIDPLDRIVVGPKPDAVYTVSGEYQKSALIFAADGDTPEFPEDFHDVIWNMALVKYGLFTGAIECVTRGTNVGNKLMNQLEGNQAVQWTIGRPLA